MILSSVASKMIKINFVTWLKTAFCFMFKTWLSKKNLAKKTAWHKLLEYDVAKGDYDQKGIEYCLSFLGLFI